MDVFNNLLPRYRKTTTKKSYSLQNVRDLITPIQERLQVKFLRKLNILMIKGSSNVLEVAPAYLRVIEEVNQHFKNSNKLTCYFNYVIINATTIKLLFNLLKVLQKAHQSKKKVTAYWIVDGQDEVVIDTGYYFWESVDFKFNIKSSKNKPKR